MTWQLTSFFFLALVLVGGGLWYERTRPSAKLVAMVAALAALAVAGRIVFAPVPNVVATTDIVLFTGYAIGGAPGFAVGALAALVSNFWLGQGPWTPWQMAGWGMVGIAGAVLARVSGRRLGRWGLAFWCGVAGVAYGALLDLSVMVTYGGEQSLDRYLALAARGFPFNAAHVAGNVVFALIAGPALVRMLLRFRERIQVRWRPLPALAPANARAGAGAALGLLLALVAAGALLGGPADPARGQSVAHAVSYLEEVQNSDGGFGIASGSDSSVGMTAWAALGLEAAGRNPLDFPDSGRTPIDYLRANAGDVRTPNDLQRTILVLEAAGVDSSDFAGRNLVSELRGQRRSDGSYRSWPNLTAYGLLALAAAGVPKPTLSKSIDWLIETQNKDGGWGAVVGAPSDSDSTAAVLQSLAVEGGAGGVVAKGVRYLRRSQRSDGGWALTESAPTNTQSTSWVIQGLVAAGVDPANHRENGKSPLDYLAARQVGDGHFRYSSASDQTPVWVTAQALLAVNRAAFPLGVVARSSPGGSEPGRGGGGESAGSASAAPGVTAPSGPAAVGSQGGGADAASGQGTNGGTEGGQTGAPAPTAAGDGLEGATGPAPLDASPDTSTSDDSDAGPWIAAAFGFAALALLGGFLWYRRRLP